MRSVIARQGNVEHLNCLYSDACFCSLSVLGDVDYIEIVRYVAILEQFDAVALLCGLDHLKEVDKIDTNINIFCRVDSI